MQFQTERYVWLAKKNFAKDMSGLDEYLSQKKKALYANKEIQEGSSLLSLLPDPWLMKDIRKAAQRIVDAIQNSEKITVFGDYDVDGTTSCAMLKEFFEDMSYPVDVYIPDRLTEGYGLNLTGVKKLAQTNTKVIITVDNGIAALAACEEALLLGVDVIITDHHDIPPVLPRAFATLNPKQKDCTFPYPMLAGVGVAFYLLIALRSLFREQSKTTVPNLRQYLDYVAIGTIADMAPITDVNYTLCKIGLEVLSHNISIGKRPGILHLLKLAGWSENSGVTAVDIGFKIGPRLNAAGRLGNALRSVEVLSSKIVDQASENAEFLNLENMERRNLEKVFTAEALGQVNELSLIPDALVLHKENWHPGVVGLVATRVLEKFYRPILVLGTLDGKMKGSGRSTHSFDLFSVLNQVRDEFISFGGHFHAVGLTLAPEKLPWLKKYLAEKARELILEKDKVPPLPIDGALSLECLKNLNFLYQLEEFEPYGVENPRTRWLISPTVVKHVKRIGKDLTQGHAKVQLLTSSPSHCIEAWVTAFGLADIFEKFLATGLEVQVVVEAKVNYWNGRTVPDIKIIDYAPVVSI